jgi:hypothetical protein
MRFDEIVHNRTFASVHAEPLLDRRGADVLAVIAKLALAFDRHGQLGLSVRPVRMNDEPDGSGGIRYPSDLAAEKVGTDIGLVGTLVPPDRPATSSIVAWLRVGPIAKAIQVFGPRVYMASLGGVAPGPAAAIGRTPLVSALAYGGRDEEARPATFEMANPVGRGHAHSPSRLAGRPAPQIEPAALPHMPAVARERSTLAQAQAPFAPIPAQWEPRLSLAGTCDGTWRRTRAPVAPEDFDPRSESWASAGLWSEAPLVGDEPVEIGGLRPGAPIRFKLPGFAPAFQSVERGEVRRHQTHLDGVLIDLDGGVVELVWRAIIPLSLKWARLERVEVHPNPPLAAGIVQRPQMEGATS